ncbi:hypothetical protein LPB72_14950 [Hydrogenophaga crassostreae]|uniref:Uncharacterized protein n=1 Tax=Hydrogenophaga crassostreae TaxID=1763535 RepID=A0A162P4A0_9BURK|nr:hypothetical protein LPB072_04700 [Hydrogenophaga crassostreae]OAD41202.1 hypothetical protein LPB72_14950 [Hydrogenophaga crassostreae]
MAAKFRSSSQSLNTVNQMRLLGQWMRLLTIPKRRSIPKAFLAFEEDGRLQPSAHHDRVVGVMEDW